MALIEVRNLTKQFKNYKTKEGLAGAVAGLFYRKFERITAVDDISFDIPEGQLVGYIGPNGAGKSTTIKMLTGILVPTSGRIQVGPYIPYRQRRDYTRNIGVVFGQRTQLWWDIAVIESFKLLRKVYQVPLGDFQDRLERFKELLDIEPLLDMPVRKLSLGQRMRCDLVASLLHNPSVLFLDEPTIGLDVIGKIRIREFLGRVNREFNTTMILTTHDLDEIEKLCKRVIIIDHGKILYDGDLEGLRRQYSTDRRITFQMSSRYSLEELRAQVQGNGAVEWEKPAPLQLRATFRMEEITPAEVIGQVLQLASVHDITIEEASIEEIVGRIYSSGKIERDS